MKVQGMIEFYTLDPGGCILADSDPSDNSTSLNVKQLYK